MHTDFPQDKLGPIIDHSHKLMVSSLLKPGQEILEQLTPSKCNLAHLAMGISGEAGELLDTIKKHVIYNQPLDMANVIEELGDIEFFLTATYLSIGISRDVVLQVNKDKLSKRYGQKYSDAAAKARADKA